MPNGGSANRDALEHARKLHAAGQPLVAVIGWRVPTEPILACGMQPILIRPDLSLPSPDADALLSADERADVRSLVQFIIDGSLDWAELVVIAPPFTTVSMTVEELRRLDLIDRSVPPVYYFELQTERSEPNRVFAQDRVRALATRMSSASRSGEARPDHDALNAAIAQTNAVRRAARELEATRHETAAPTGSEVMSVMGAADRLSPAEHLDAITQSIAATREQSQNKRALLVTSSVLGDARIHSLIEAAGLIVVGEDDIYGSCHSTGDIAANTADPIAAIGDFYHDNQPPQRTTPEEIRRKWYREAVKRDDVDCVIFYAEYAYWGWDVPALRQLADDAGKPSLVLELDVRIPAKAEKAREMLDSFAATPTAENAR